MKYLFRYGQIFQELHEINALPCMPCFCSFVISRKSLLSNTLNADGSDRSTASCIMRDDALVIRKEKDEHFASLCAGCASQRNPNSGTKLGDIILIIKK